MFNAQQSGISAAFISSSPAAIKTAIAKLGWHGAAAVISDNRAAPLPDLLILHRGRN